MVKILISLLVVVCSAGFIQAQRTVYFYNDLSIVPSIEVEKENEELQADHILQKDTLTYTNPELLGTVFPQYSYWLRFDIAPYMHLYNVYDTIYLNTINFEIASFYLKDGDNIRKENLNFFEDKKYKNEIINRTFIPITKDNLLTDRYVLIKMKVVLGRVRWSQTNFYINTSNRQIIHDYDFFGRVFTRQIPVFIFLGLAGALFILNLLLFLNSRNKIYLFYGLFLLFQTIYYLRMYTSVNAFWEYSFPLVFHILTSVIQIAINLAYLMFIRSFLEMPTYYPKLDKVIVIVAWFLVTLIVVDSLILYINPFFSYQSYVMDFQRYFMSLFALYGIIHLFIFRKSNLVHFVIVGTIIFVTGALVALFAGHIKYMLIGAAIESLIFAAGLAYRIRSVYEEKLKIEKEALSASKSALRAQINPHFIFNALSSIQHLITTQDHRGALKYLSKFSHLLRQILENSIEINVPLKREIELLELYLDLESLRFSQSFEYMISVDETLDVHNEEMPLFLIQPYVENAIIHGLMPVTDREKKLIIEFFDSEEYILCVITDNGIGRKAAKIMGKKSKYISRGISVARKRLDMINRNKPRKTLVNFEDSDSGTKVIIHIPKL